ncbi:hypothetical protein D3C87_10280 [compost metagenome]
MGRKSNIALIFFLGVFLFSCHSNQKGKKITLFEKLQKSKGYLNSSELKKLDYDYSLKLLDQYDFSGYDEEDTLAYFVRSGSYIWVASCYIGDNDNPFFCLKETKEKQFKMVQHGIIPVVFGECEYELDRLLTLVGKTIIVSQKSSGNGYCDDKPLIFHADGKMVLFEDRIHLISRACSEDKEMIFCFERDFKYSLENKLLSVHVKEKKIDQESEQVINYQEYDLRYSLAHNFLKFKDTLRN